MGILKDPDEAVRILGKTERSVTELIRKKAPSGTFLIRKKIQYGSPESAQNLFIKLAAVRDLYHPNLLKIYDIDDIGPGLVSYSREYAPGAPILESILSEDEFLESLIRIADLLCYFHGSQIGGFFLPPSRIFFSRAEAAGQNYLFCFPHELDFLDEFPEKYRAFLPPESAETGTADFSADLYPVGKLVLEWFGKARGPAGTGKELTQRLLKISEKLVCSVPSGRYSSALDLLEDLLSVLPAIARKTKTTHPRMEIPVVPMTGRSSTLDKLTVHAERALGEEGKKGHRVIHLVLLSGGPGMGKSRILRELVGRLRKPGRFISFGDCYSQEMPVYQPFRKILRQFFSRMTIQPALVHPFSRALKKLIPELLLKEAFTPWAELKSEDEKLRLIEGIAQFFLKLSDEKRLIIMLEDLHFIDDASLELLRYLLRNIYILAQDQKRPGIFICGTYDPLQKGGKLPILKMLAELGEEVPYEEIHLQPFSEPMQAELLNVISDSFSLSPQIPVRLEKRGLREPLLYEQVAYLVKENKRFRMEDIDALPVGTNRAMREVVLRRKGFLSREELRILEFLAVLGKPASLALLKVSRKRSKNNVYRMVQRLVWKGWVSAVSTGREHRYALAHDEIRKILYEEFSEDEKKILHLRAGLSLDALYSHEPSFFVEELAYHFLLAENPSKGIRYGLSAGNELRALYANSKALQIFETVYELMRRRKGLRSQIEVLKKISELHFLLGSYDRAVEAAWRLTKIGEKIVGSRVIARCFRLMGEAYREKGEWDRAIECFDKGLAIIEKHRCLDEASRIYGLKGHIFVLKGDFASASEACARGLKLAEKLRRSHELAAAYNSFGSIHWVMGNLQSAIEYYQKSFEISQELGRKQESAVALNNLGMIFCEQLDLSKAIDYCKKSLSIKESIGDIRGIVNSAINLAVYFFRKYDYEVAEKYAWKGLELARKIGYHRGVSFCLSNIAETQMWWGHYSKAIENTRKSLKIAEKMGEMRRVCNFLNRLGHLYYLLGETSKALEYCERALKLAEELKHKESLASAYELKAEVFSCLQKNDEAVRLFESAETIAREMQHEEMLAGILIESAFLNFELGQFKNAEGKLEEAELIAKKLNLKKDWAKILLLKARMQRQVDKKREKALDYLTEAIDICGRICFPEMSWQILQEMAEIHETAGNYREAQNCLRKAAEELRHITNQLEEDEVKYLYLQHPKRLKVMKSLRIYH